MHTPVLLQQAIENLNIFPKGKYIDATFGEGGYSKEIIKKGGKVLGIDLDEKQIENWIQRHPELVSGSEKEMLKRVQHDIVLVQGNFAEIEKIAKENNFYPVDGILFDLGLSTGQLDNSGRGFSYKKEDEPLDMRLDLKSQLTVKKLIEKSTFSELYEILIKNSEEIKAKDIAEKIKLSKKMETVGDLVKAIDKAVGFKNKSIYARIFQALRIEVNNEFENLKKGLIGSLKILKKGGRIIIVSFHSLEDRIIKNFVRENGLIFLNKKPIRGWRSFERSAKLRIIINEKNN